MAIAGKSLISSEQTKTKGTCLNQAPISARWFFISIFFFDFSFYLDTPNQNQKQNVKDEHPTQTPARTRPWRPPQLRTLRRPDSRTTESRKHTKNMPLVPVNATSITAVEPVAHGAVHHRMSTAVYKKNPCVAASIMLFGKRPVHRRSRDSGYRRPCISRLWTAK